MIEIMKGLPADVLGIDARGTVTKDDYEKVILPATERLIREFGKINVIYRAGNEFKEFTAGAMWDDFKLGISHPLSWKKVAVVSNLDWLRKATNFFKHLMPAEVKFFSDDQLPDAVRWVTDQ